VSISGVRTGVARRSGLLPTLHEWESTIRGFPHSVVVQWERYADHHLGSSCCASGGPNGADGWPVTRGEQARQALGVHRQRVARARPLEAPDLLARYRSSRGRSPSARSARGAAIAPRGGTRFGSPNVAVSSGHGSGLTDVRCRARNFRRPQTNRPTSGLVARRIRDSRLARPGAPLYAPMSRVAPAPSHLRD
jgi:hypothetical protein